MRFSLKWLLATLAFVGFGCVALYNANEAWAAAARLVTVFVLLVAIVGAIYSESRAFCVGMCVLGWGFLLLNFFPSTRIDIIDISALLDVAYRPMVRSIPIDGSVPNGAEVTASYGGYGAGGYGGEPTVYTMPVRANFHYIGHSLFAIVFAIIGGVVGVWFSRSKRTVG